MKKSIGTHNIYFSSVSLVIVMKQHKEDYPFPTKSQNLDERLNKKKNIIFLIKNF